MFTAEIVEAIHLTPPGQSLTVIVEWGLNIDRSPSAPVPTMEDINRQRQAMRANLVRWLEDKPAIEWQELHGAIGGTLSASKAVWEDIVGETTSPLHGGDVLLHLNKEITPNPLPK